MKTKNIILILSLLFCFLLTGCVKEQPITVDGFEISPKVYKNIVETLKKEGYDVIAEIGMLDIVAEFDDVYVFLPPPTQNDSTTEEYMLVGDIIFWQVKYRVYYKKNLYTIKEAYEEKILTDKEVEEIYIQFTKTSPYEVDIKIITPQDLYLISKNYYLVNNIKVDNGYVVEMCSSDFGLLSAYENLEDNFVCATILIEPNDKSEVLYETVNDLEFKFFKGYKLIIYKDGICYSLQEAFDKGIVSEKSLTDIYEHNQYIYNKQW